jgi:class 3 adenylate cyclase
VREQAGGRIAVRPLEAVAVRGKSRPVEIYELTGIAG